MSVEYLLLLVLLIGVAVYVRRQSDATSRVRFLRRAAFGLLAAVTVLGGAFLVGETIDDPGGLAAVGWIAAWLVPLAGLIVLAWRRPPFALPTFVTLTAAELGLSVWAAVHDESWRAVEDDHGPVRTVVVFVLAAAIGVYGLHHPRVAGWLLVTLGGTPLAVSGLGATLARGSLLVAATPALIAGVLYLAAAHLDQGAASEPLIHPPDREGIR